LERLCRLSPDELEALVSCDGLEFDDATYPPPCDPPSGPLRLRRHERGGVVLEVSPRRVPLDDFVLSVLFGTGSCMFSGSYDVARFFRGSVASALGIECEPLPPRISLEPEVDEERLEPPAQRLRKASRLRVPDAGELALALARSVHGQEAALAQVSRAVARHLAKRSPRRPESLLLIGPTGTGKTSTVELLAFELGVLEFPAHVFRVDCGELVNPSDIRRILGAPPSYVGYVDEPPLVAALRAPGCILLLDEVEKADEAVHDVFLGLLDAGTLTAPDGETIQAQHTIVVLTTNLGADDLAYRLRDLPPGSRAEQQVCREHLLREEWPAELVGRIGTVVVYDELTAESRRGVAESAIRSLAAEFGFTVLDLPGVLVDVVGDLADADDIGARAYAYAARDLLGDAFADAVREGLLGTIAVDPGPPPRVVRPVRRRSRARAT